MNNINITSVSVADYKLVQLIGKETFYETFASGNSEEDMQKYLSVSFHDEKVKEELLNEDSLFFIAWEGDVAVGYLEIERIYVKSTHHGKGVGQLLYDKAFEVAKHKNKKSIWLGVWEENPRAIKFYEKNGFVEFDRHLFKMGKDEQTDIMMKKTLPEQ
jgi:ribosomal protein S18 acetylase RimI-like enzyme